MIDLDDFRPHWVVKTENGVHVIPDLLLTNWITGKVTIGEDDIPVIRTIINEWREAYERHN